MALTELVDLRLQQTPREHLRILFLMPRLGFLRFFQGPLDAMIDRGWDVHLRLESDRYDLVEERWLRRARTHANFTCDVVDHFRHDPSRKRRVGLRLGMEFVRRLGPSYANRSAGKRGARLSRAPKLIQRAANAPLLRTSTGLRAMYAVLAAIDRALPLPAPTAGYIRELAPDVVAVCDKGQPGSLSSAYVKAALEAGVPTALLVASWDNLTNRQRTPVIPHALLVWNERQRKEAFDFHGIPADRVVMTGAPRFDEWFTWPPRPREEFLARVGLDPERPVILWIGCALNPAAITEAEFVSRWLTALRHSEDPVLREAGVLVRPHPERFDDWRNADYTAFGNVALWPRDDMPFPIADDAKADYFDSIYHADAVVGINTSAMVEASIVGRRVLTVLVPEFHTSQLATFHFNYLLESEGGPVRVAKTMDEHLDDLRAALAEDNAVATDAVRPFVRSFVRPHGLERAATDVFVDALEELARRPVMPDVDPAWVRALRPVAARALRDVHYPRTRHVARRLVKAGRRARMRAALRTRLAARRRKLQKTFRRMRRHVPRLAWIGRRADRLRLRRVGALQPLIEFRRAQPPGSPRRDYDDLFTLYELVREHQPETVVAFGADCSTVVIAGALAHNGRGHLEVIEPDERRAAAADAAIPAALREFADVRHGVLIEEEREGAGWSLAHALEAKPDFVYLAEAPHTKARPLFFGVLDLEAQLRPGSRVVIDGHIRTGTYHRDQLTRIYRIAEDRPRRSGGRRFVFELLDESSADDLPTVNTVVARAEL